MTFSPGLLAVGVLLVLVQAIAAVPWVLALVWDLVRGWHRKQGGRALLSLGGIAVGVVVGLGLLLGALLGVVRDRGTLESFGRIYASVLQLQLSADLFVLIFVAVLAVWPKGGAVARAAFRESYRQPMFWLFVLFAVGMMILLPFVPYFTFGEDHIMVKELGYDTIILAAVAFGAIAASMSISEEIEGRTAVTLMSKPVSRRQFLLGKFFGILMACLVLVAALGWGFCWLLLYKNWFDKIDPQVLPASVVTWVDGLTIPVEARNFLDGILLWTLHIANILPGLVMSSSMIMVLLAVAVALATRMPMVVNLVTCLVLFFLANLMPVLVQTTRPTNPTTAGPVQKLIYFVAQLFDALLPGLELFRVRPTLVDEASLPFGDYLQHVAAVGLYGLLFTAIALLLGLVLFEDRDLA
jgi:ABC-2 family transporter protein